MIRKSRRSCRRGTMNLEPLLATLALALMAGSILVIALLAA
ncbi:MAG TPA: hypothetical protein VNN10_05205 [Dehalococcoidia bacterium]|nr:hypothetical protein [Dehalococcoidia bacterium]